MKPGELAKLRNLAQVAKTFDDKANQGRWYEVRHLADEFCDEDCEYIAALTPGLVLEIIDELVELRQECDARREESTTSKRLVCELERPTFVFNVTVTCSDG